MEINENIFIVIKEALEINHATILESNDNYLLVNDDLGEVFYIAINNQNVDVIGLIEIGKQYQSTVAIISLFDMDVPDVSGFRRILKVKQFSYHGGLIDIDSPYVVKDMDMSDYPYLAKHYYRNGDDEEYLKDSIKRGMLKVVNDNNEIMGFIGEHPEHAMGMLYIDEAYRRQGLGRLLEKALINKFIKEGKVPFDHVVLDNNKSLNLQKSIEGMSLDEGSIIWFF